MKRFKVRQIYLLFILILSGFLITGCGGSGGVTETGHWLPTDVVSIEVTPPNPSIALGTNQQFMATGIYAENAHFDLTSSVIWKSLDTTIATFDNKTGPKGLAHGVRAGTTKITATDPATGIFGTATLTVKSTSVTLTSIEVTPVNPTRPLGINPQFTATGIFSDNTTQPLTSSVHWISLTESIATISDETGSKGLATTVAVGVTTIRATDPTTGIKGDSILTVTNATLVSIAVTPVNPTRPIGINPQFTATGTYTYGPTQDLTSLVHWSSLTESIATISDETGSKGLAKTVAVGVTTIKAIDSTGIFGTTNLTVTAVTLLSIEVTPVEKTIARGTKQQFIAMGTYSDGTRENLTSLVTWSPLLGTNPVAWVSNAADGSNGLATSLTEGGPIEIKATVPHTLPVISGTAQLTVTAAELVSIAVDPVSASIYVGATQQFIATGTYTDGMTQPLTTRVTWSTPPMDTPVAFISNAEGSKGEATALTVGGPIRIHVIDPDTLKFGNAKLTVKAAPILASCAGPGPVDMGAADSFGVLVGPAGGATLTVTNPTSVTGDTGAESYVPAVGVSTLVGTKYTGSSAPYMNAKAAMLTAISCASARACSAGSAFNINADYDFGGKTLAPGVYCVAGGMSVGSNLTLSTPGVYIFRSTGALTSSNTITMAFGGTANATNTSVFWVPTGAASIGSDNAFLGTIMPGASAATTLGANTTLLPGRVLSNSDVTLDKNTIAKPTY